MPQGNELRSAEPKPRNRRTYDASDLDAIRDLSPAAAGEWTSTGPQPQLLLKCVIPAGWMRVQIALDSDVYAPAEIYLDTGSGFHSGARIQLGHTRPGFTFDGYVRVEKPIRAIRFDPLNCPARFDLRRFRVRALSVSGFRAEALLRRLHAAARGGRLSAVLRNGMHLLARGELRMLRQKAAAWLSGEREARTEDYPLWLARHQVTPAVRETWKAQAAALPDGPVIAVLMPTYNVDEGHLRAAIESVCGQSYPRWELCIADDASTQPHVRKVLEEYAAKDPRIKVRFRERNGHISAASNTALELVTAPYVALLDNDDILAEHALLRVVEAAAREPAVDWVYSDEDKLSPAGTRCDPFFKPDWSPEYLLSTMYICHLTAYRTSLVRKVGGFRSAYDHAQDFDLALRVMAEDPRVVHVPEILYHWRMAAGSTSLSFFAKPHAHERARAALEDYLGRTGEAADVVMGASPGIHRVRFRIKGDPKVSIVIPSACRPAKLRGRRTYFVTECVASVRRLSTWKNTEVLVVDNDDMPAEVERRLTACGARRVRFTGEFNLAAKMNLGAREAAGSQLVFLNDDIEVITPDWIECLLEQSQREAVGAVGAKLFFLSGQIQHVGVAILDGKPGHPFYLAAGHHAGYQCSNLLTRNCIAVTGACMMTRRGLFLGLGGFDEHFPLNYNDVDYCMRLRAAGKRIVFTPHAQLYHYESVSKSGTYTAELERFRAKWGAAVRRDPYFNPNFSTQYWDYRLDLGPAATVDAADAASRAEG